MSRARSYLLFVAVSVLCLCSGCGTKSAKSNDADFAPGAFPPTLSDTEYHTRAWGGADCLTCHKTGIDKAPKIRHTSLAPLTKEASCRTCHVFVAGSKPAP